MILIKVVCHFELNKDRPVTKEESVLTDEDTPHVNCEPRGSHEFPLPHLREC